MSSRKLKITLTRSPIGLKPDHVRTLQALGLRRIRATVIHDDTAVIRGMVAKLEARLKENPNDLDGWKRLGRAFSALNDHAKAAEAYRRAHALAPGDTQVMADLAGAIIRGQPQGREVTPEAVDV